MDSNQEIAVRLWEDSEAPYDVNSASCWVSIKSDPPTNYLKHESVSNEDTAKSEWKRHDKLKNKMYEFRPYDELVMKDNQDFYKQALTDINKNKIMRGRKRANVMKKTKNLHQLIYDVVIPRWGDYLHEKKEKEDSAKHFIIRSDAVWKKIMRDWREFYRILFKNRFHRMDYQEHGDKIKCIQILIRELGFPEFCEKNLIYSYNFFHQIHLSETNKDKYNQVISKSVIGFDALTRYTNESRTMFLEDSLWSRLLFFLYRNFQEVYFKLLSVNIKDNVQECIVYLLTQYNKLKSDDDVICTSSLPI